MLAASLAGPGVYWLKGKYQRDLTEIQRAYHQEKAHAERLAADGVADVLQVEDEAFPLAYSPDALARIHRLIGGQPFLVQLLGNGLVQHFNRRLREEIPPPPATLSEEDVEAVLVSGELYDQGAVYFRGIWEQAGVEPAGQHALLRALAPHPEDLDEARLGRHTDLSSADLTAALQTLRDHDVLVAEGDRYRYTVELMRLWVAGGKMDSG